MAEFKIVINDVKTGKSYQKTVSDSSLVGKKIGDKVDGKVVGLTGYELEIKGGSDTAGFPMIVTVDTSGRKKALLSKGPGVKIKRDGMIKRKTVRGNTISDKTAQINLKIIKYGTKKVEELLGIEKKEESPAAEEKKSEEKPAEKKESPQEDKKQEEKPKESKEGDISEKTK